jgi:putative copper export protein
MSNKTFAAMVLGLTALFVAGIMSMALIKDDERKEFMRECQDSGMRHYQCIAMWRGGLSMLVLPVDVN